MNRDFNPEEDDLADAFEALAKMRKESAKGGQAEADYLFCLSRCKDLCARHRVTASQLANFWESLSLQQNLKFGRDAIARFDTYLRTSVVTPIKSKPASNIKSDPNRSFKGDDDDVMEVDDDDGGFAKAFSPLPKLSPAIKSSPNSKKRGRESIEQLKFEDTKLPELLSPAVNPSAGSITTSRQYLERKDAGKVLQAFPATETALPTEVTPNFDPDEVHVRVEDGTGAHKPYRYMFDTVDAKDNAVQGHVKTLTDAIVEKYALGELIDRTRAINVPHQESSVYVGELTSEGEGLNEKTIQLASGHIRVRLDIGDLPSYSLFCGQSVAVKGLNGMGTRIVVESLYHDAPLPHFAPPKLGEGADEDEPDESELRSQQLRVMVAAGPFSTRDDLRYYPLNDLLDKVHQRKPHALILMGPFIDSDHPDIAGCTIDRPFEDAFEEIIEKIASHLENMSTRIVLVPSLRDVVHDYVFPQPPLSLNAKLRQFTNVECVPNPSMIRINGVSFGLISSDVLKHMMSQVAYKEPKAANGAAPAGGSERVSSLSQHIINQRTFYPVRPSPSASSGECQLDFAQWDKCDLTYTPDVLVFVSSLPTFVKQYGNTVCANVGRLVTGKTAGTYMELNISAATGLPSESGPGVGSRTKAAIVRI